MSFRDIEAAREAHLVAAQKAFDCYYDDSVDDEPYEAAIKIADLAEAHWLAVRAQALNSARTIVNASRKAFREAERQREEFPEDEDVHDGYLKHLNAYNGARSFYSQIRERCRY